ncbi:MAG: hypothetical protein RIR26_1829, partial [Pseudomonadota bacterium]
MADQLRKLKNAQRMGRGKSGTWALIWTSFVLASNLGTVLSGCDSKAKVQWEDKQRTEIKNKIDSVITDKDLSALYNKTASGLTVEERPLLNSIFSTIMERNPSQANKTTTLKAVLLAIEDLKATPEMRSKLPVSLANLLEITKKVDASVQLFAESISAEKESGRLTFLETAKRIVLSLEQYKDFKSHLESVSTRADKANFVRIVNLWDTLGSDGEKQENMLDTLLTAANSGDSGELSRLLTQIESGTNRPDIFLFLKEMRFEDKNLVLFLKIFNRVNVETYPHLIALMKTSNDPALAPDLLFALEEALRKSVPLNPSLVSGYISSARSVVDGKNALVQLNTLTTSVDTLSGEGFYTRVGFANKYISFVEPLVCKVFGLGSERITYSFQWTINGTKADWTEFGSSASNSTGLISDRGDEVLCAAKIAVDNVVVTVPALETDLVTVKPPPPEFISGDPPSVERLSMLQGETITTAAEAYTYVGTSSSTMYKISTLPLQGTASIDATNRTITYIPLRSYSGEDSFEYQACDNEFTCSAGKKVIVT